MLRTYLLGLCIAWLAFGGDKAATLVETTQTITVRDVDIVPLHASLKETTLVVLP